MRCGFLWKDSEAVIRNKSFIDPAVLDVLLVLVGPNPTITIPDVISAMNVAQQFGCREHCMGIGVFSQLCSLV